MIRVKIPKQLKLGAISCRIKYGGEINKLLQQQGFFGRYALDLDGRQIKLDDSRSEAELNHTFIHECVEFIDSVFVGRSLPHKTITQLANGLHQLLEQLGIRFVKEK